MLAKPNYGWSEITIGNVILRCSYIDDVPFDLLDALSNAKNTGKPSAVKFDAEGWEYTIVFDAYETHLIVCDLQDKYHYYTVEVDLDKFIEECVADIRRDLKDWGAWYCTINLDDKNKIDKRCDDLYWKCFRLEQSFQSKESMLKE